LASLLRACAARLQRTYEELVKLRAKPAIPHRNSYYGKLIYNHCPLYEAKQV